MTLSTDIYILDEIDPKLVFFQCQALLAQYDMRHRKPEEQKWSEFPDGNWKLKSEVTEDDVVTPGMEFTGADKRDRVWVVMDNPTWSRDNEVGQNLPAWLMTAFRPDGFIRPDGEACEPGYCDDDTSNPDAYHYHQPAHYMKVDFDTTYGYRDERGWNCGDLHAALVTQLGLWLNQQGVRWCWRNEYTGEIYQGHDGIHTLSDGAVDACDWFENLVKPAIEAHAAQAGGKVEWL